MAYFPSDAGELMVGEAGRLRQRAVNGPELGLTRSFDDVHMRGLVRLLAVEGETVAAPGRTVGTFRFSRQPVAGDLVERVGAALGQRVGSRRLVVVAERSISALSRLLKQLG